MQYNIACVRSGNSKYRFYYVERLYDMLERDLTVPFKLFQFTDHPEEKDSRIENIDISGHEIRPNSCWAKLAMFDHVKTNPIDDDFLYIDLDTIIVDNIDEFVTCRPRFNTITLLEYVRRNYTDTCRDKYGSHFMYISKDFGQSIWNNFSRNKEYHYKKYKTGDERVIEQYTPKNRVVLWKNLIPSLDKKIVSIHDPKVDWSETGRREHKPYSQTSIVYCHGSPKPHHIAFGDKRFPDLTTPNWFKKAWKLEDNQKEDTLPKPNIIDSKSQEKLSIVTFKWNNNKLLKEYFVDGHATLPNEDKNIYGPDHVNKMYNMVKRNLKNRDFEFVLITDQDEREDGLIDKNIRIEPLWNDLRQYGGCTHRLKLLSSEMKDFLRPQFVQMDLDMVITGSLDELFSRQDDFVIYGMREGNRMYSKYRIPCNGSIWMNKTGTLSHLYDEYNFQEALEAKRKYNFIGSDQLWFAYKLFQEKDRRGASVSTWGPEDGIYDFLSDIMKNTPGWQKCTKGNWDYNIRFKLPSNSKIVTFPGARDVSERKIQKTAPWIQKYWK